jgi:6-pyruvoyltetrahydropterin/6-carboxytetrahydropterin synthase
MNSSNLYKTEYSIKKEGFKFECSHRLNHLDYDSPCKNLHGHSYKVFVEIFNDTLDKNGMVIDFSKLKSFQDHLDKYYDHAIIIYIEDKELINIAKKLNWKYLIYHKPTTAENMAQILSDELVYLMEDDIYKIKVTVYETEKNSASYTIENITRC